MYVCSDYQIEILDQEKDLESAVETINSHIDYDGDLCWLDDSQILVEEDTATEMQDIVNRAKEIAKCLPNTDFTMKGRIDATESAGEEDLFIITVKDGKLKAVHTDWVQRDDKSAFDSYEDFLEMWGDISETLSEEEFDNFDGDEMIILNDGNGPIVPEGGIIYEVFCTCDIL